MNTQEAHSPLSSRPSVPWPHGQNPADTSRPLHTTLPDAHGHQQERLPAILFSGTLQESFPLALLYDKRLTPLERNTWQIFKAATDKHHGLAAPPRYKDLQELLGMYPGSCASAETVARSIARLRLTRWLSLREHRRDALSGRLQTSLYFLHERPLSAEEAVKLDKMLHLDDNYVKYAAKCLHHADKSIRKMAELALQDLEQIDPDKLSETVQELIKHMRQTVTRHLPTKSSEAAEGRMQTSQQSPASAPASVAEVGAEAGKNGQKTRTSATEAGRGKPTSAPTSATEAGRKASESALLRQPKQVQTPVQSFCTACKNKHTEPVCTEPRETKNPEPPEATAATENSVWLNGKSEIIWPQALNCIREMDRRSLLHDLKGIEPALIDEVLNTAAARIQSGSVESPGGYLRTLIGRARSGQFKSTQQSRAESAHSPWQTAFVAAPIPAGELASKESVKAHMAKLRALFKGRPEPEAMV